MTDADGMEWSVEPIDPIILNALVEIEHEDATAVADEHSRTLVSEAFDESVDAGMKAEFNDVAQTAKSGDGSMNTEGEAVLESVVGSVRERLAEDGVVATLTHENALSLTPEQSAVYTFSRTRNPAHLSRLDVSDSVMQPIENASGDISDENWAGAADTLDEAVDAARTIDEEVQTRTVAALCHHWSGDDQRAVDLVAEAVSLDSDTWLPWLPGYSAEADSAYATTDEFREGKYAVSAFLRYIANVPERASVTPFIGYSDTGDIEWEQQDVRPVCSPLGRLDEETHIRFEIRGPVDAFPSFQAYYIGLGIVDLEVGEIRDVLEVLEDGPTGDDVTETVQFEQQSG